MKIALAQLNYHIGNFEANVSKITHSIKKAKNENVDLIVFSELSVCGYPPHDLLEQEDFINNCNISVKKIAAQCSGIAAIVGAPSINTNKKGKNLFNSAFFLSEGKIQHIFNKSLLPTYDVFDESRYFEPNSDFKTITYKGKKIAVTICEDLWDKQPVNNQFAKNQLYINSPMDELNKLNPDFVINISASPFSFNQSDLRKNILIEKAKNFNIPIFYVNQVGAQTELIFDGGSMVLNSSGKIVERLHFFKEDYKVVDIKEINNLNYKETKKQTIEKIHDALVLGIRDYFNKMNFKQATLGLSGGIDSAITAVLAVRALGKENVRVLLLPSKYSSAHSITDAVGLAENLGIQYEIVSIKEATDIFEKILNPLFKGCKPDITEENIQARIRGLLLMAISNKFGHILLNTTNKSEAAVGYGTLYGDMCGGMAVLGDVYKTDVFKLAHFINKDNEIIPNNTIVKPPSAELRPDQKDTDSLPDYDTLDNILYQYIELKQSKNQIIDKGFDPVTVKKIITLVNRNEYKRFQAPPILRISSKAFGEGRKIPLVAKY
ncbi:MAG: NAD+ synthase [Bacteroidales bacterium]|nr:NAD+ synthase [Bacteroidales bacterium]